MNNKIGELLKGLDCEFVSEDDREFRFIYHEGEHKVREFILDKIDLNDDKSLMYAIKTFVECTKNKSMRGK